MRCYQLLVNNLLLNRTPTQPLVNENQEKEKKLFYLFSERGMEGGFIKHPMTTALCLSRRNLVRYNRADVDTGAAGGTGECLHHFGRGR